MRMAASRVRAALLGAVLIAAIGAPAAQPRNATLTAVAGVRVGHFTLPERPTGCTVVLTPDGVIAGVDVRGSAPGTRETDLLNPVNLVDKVNAIVLAGGSAFGLDAATGVMRWLDEHGAGYDAGAARVPIVPAAILFDLGLGDPRVRPTADCGYRAAERASGRPVDEGSIGAGAGATIGKLRGLSRAMKGGVGSAAIVRGDGLTVAALAVVNALGDIVDPASGRVIAGVRTADGRGLADARTLLTEAPPPSPARGQNTTLAVVATNARLTKTQATKVAQMAQDGLARAIVPAHTPYDGDTVFALATGARERPDDLLVVGALAAEATAQAIVRAAKTARGVEGVPGVGEVR